MDAAEHTDLTKRYDSAAGQWHDKMRLLGYYDAYLGFLSQPDHRPCPNARLVDMGAGTAAMSEAWVAVNGPPDELVLVDPSTQMLERGASALARHMVTSARMQQGYLGQTPGLTDYDEVLAAHLIEHCPDPTQALSQLRAILRPGGVLRLVVSKPHWCNTIIWLQWRHRTFDHAEIRQMLAQTGFGLLSQYAFPSGPPSRTSMGFVARAL